MGASDLPCHVLPDGIILTRIVQDGPIMLDLPGITVTDCFPPGVA